MLSNSWLPARDQTSHSPSREACFPVPVHQPSSLSLVLQPPVEVAGCGRVTAQAKPKENAQPHLIAFQGAFTADPQGFGQAFTAAAAAPDGW